MYLVIFAFQVTSAGVSLSCVEESGCTVAYYCIEAISAEDSLLWSAEGCVCVVLSLILHLARISLPFVCV